MGTAASPARRHRGSLSPHRIVEESLRLLDESGVSGLSFPKLGRALGCDPTAIYRHFASKDDLILAIADHLIEESARGVVPSECWVDTLTDVAQHLRTTYQAHPAAASLSSFRTTRRPAEMHAVDTIIGAVLQAGFRGALASVVYRAFGDFCLSFAGGEAALLALEPEVQHADRAAWAGAYLMAPREQYPNIWKLRDALPKVDDDQIFETVLGIFLDGMMLRAPTPCTCGRHTPGRAGRRRR